MEKIDPSKIIIRSAKITDAESCVPLINSLVKEKAMISIQKKITVKQEKEYFKALIKDVKAGKAISFVLDLNGKVMGIAGVSRENNSIGRHIGLIGIFMSSKVRGMGLGEKLFRVLMNEGIKKCKFRILKLNVFAENKIAFNLYTKVGFEKIGLIKGGVSYFGEYKDEIVMVKYIK